jgi:hypothetical protein
MANCILSFCTDQVPLRVVSAEQYTDSVVVISGPSPCKLHGQTIAKSIDTRALQILKMDYQLPPMVVLDVN